MTDTNLEPKGPSAALPKPRLILMGEFSSGKSTLSNILLGGPTLPMQVTATRLPPVHVSYGEPSAYAITRDGNQVEVDLSNLGDMTPEMIRSIHLTMVSDTLELCDLVDMPGISDPNMPTDTWDEVVRKTDHVIWCTHATQAWRQSEAAFWDRMRDTTSGQNLLLVTQFDKLRNARDQSRVLSRTVKETEGKFMAVYPVSLLDALRAEDDFDAWQASGANDFMEHLIEILMNSGTPPELTSTSRMADLGGHQAADGNFGLENGAAQVARPDFRKPDRPQSDAPPRPNFGAAKADGKVIPRRVRLSPDIRRPTRPLRSATNMAGAWPVEPGAM